MRNDDSRSIDPAGAAGHPYPIRRSHEQDAAPQRAEPLRAAAIDVGSNAIRFLAAELDASGGLATLAYDRAAVRLGHDVFETGRIGSELLEAAVAALVQFRERMDDLGITRYRAVATSAVRESANGQKLIERARTAAGIVLETIGGVEEAELVLRAVRAHVPIASAPWLLVDIGGGSVEITLADAERILDTASHPAGAVRLLEQYGDGDAADLRRAIETRVAALPLPGVAGPAVAGFVATGGNSDALADLREPQLDDRGVSRLSLGWLRKTIERLAAASLEERMSCGLRADRADVILPAAIIYEGLCTRARCDELWIPRVGVREGVILDVAKHRSVEDTSNG